MSRRKPRRAPNGSGSINQLPNGRWRASIPIGWLPSGNVKRISKVFDTFKEADTWRMQMILDRDRGALILPDNTTLTELIDRWEADNPHWAPSTTFDRIGTLRRHVTPYLGDRPVRDLKPAEISGLLGILRKDRPNPTPGAKPEKLKAASEQTIHRTVRHLRAVLDFAVQVQLEPRNAAAGIKTTRVAPVKRARWTVEETRDVLAAAATYGQTHAVGNYLYLALMTGMRREELLGLRWADVDTRRRTISIRQVVTDLNGALRFGPPKTSASERDVPVDATTLQALEQQRAVQALQRKAAGDKWDDLDLVFTNRTGGPLRYKQLRHHLNIISAQAGVNPIRLYDTRSTHGSILAETGVNPKAISERLGHTDVGFTMRTYVRTSENEGRAIAEAMGALGAQPCAADPESPLPDAERQARERPANERDTPAAAASSVTHN